MAQRDSASRTLPGPAPGAVGPGVAVMAAFIVAIVVSLVVLEAGASGQEETPPGVATQTIDIVHRPLDEVIAPVIVDRLDPTTVLIVRARGFKSDTTGTVRQCTEGAKRDCRNIQPVRFDENGGADFQYLIADGGGCRLRDERCTIEIRVDDLLSVIDTVFVDEGPPLGIVTVTPSRGLLSGDTVTVTVGGFARGAALKLMVCAAPATRGPRCGAPGPDLELLTDTDGTASVEITLEVQEVGTDRVACGRRIACSMVVTSEEAVVRALPVRLHFNEAPGASYDGVRIGIGVGVVLALVVVALWLVRSIDWAPPREADGRAIDDAEYANLDLEAEQFDETHRSRVET